MGGRVAARLHRVPARVVAAVARSVVTLARPELVERRPTWGAGKRNFASVYLEPLSDAAMRDLLGDSFRACPTRRRGQILARAEGVPLYAVETVRMLLDRGALVREGSVYRPTGRVETLEVPETLHALIAARLDGLRPTSGRCSRTRGARENLHPGGARGAGQRRRGLDGVLRRWCARRCSRSRPIRARRSTASTGSCRT